MYNGKTVLITGDGKGVGRMLADHFAINRAKLIRMPGKEYLDLRDPNAIMDFVAEMSKEPIDIFINNAAVLTSQYILKMPLQSIMDMVNTNIIGGMLMIKGFASNMRSGGRIVNISSMAVALEPMGDSVYAATKAAMEKFTNILAKEMQTFGVTCNTLAISAIETDMLKQLNKEKIDAVVGKLPVSRYAKPGDIYNVVDFFCSHKSSYITAQTIYLGGVHA